MLTKSISAPNCSTAERNEKGAKELAELRLQLERALASNRAHVRSIHALWRTVARMQGENVELTRLCVAAELIDEQSIYSSDEEETTEEDDVAEDTGPGDGRTAQVVTVVMAPGVSTMRGRGAHTAPLVDWPPSDLDPNDVSIVPTFDFGNLGMIRCDCHKVIGVMGCVCVGQCADLLKQEYALANDPNPDGGGFNDDGDWRGTVRLRCTIIMSTFRFPLCLSCAQLHVRVVCNVCRTRSSATGATVQVHGGLVIRNGVGCHGASRLRSGLHGQSRRVSTLGITCEV